MTREKYKPETKEELIDLIEKKVKFNKIDTSLITDMSGIFENSILRNFSGIETWDTSKVENMMSMFEGAQSFNQNLDSWVLSKNAKMYMAFYCSAMNYNTPIWYKN